MLLRAKAKNYSVHDQVTNGEPGKSYTSHLIDHMTHAKLQNINTGLSGCKSQAMNYFH